MSDNLSFFGILGSLTLLGIVDSVPAWIQDGTPTAIIGFVVWFTLTRLENVIKTLDTSIRELSENVKSLKGDHEFIEKELDKIEQELNK